jgi:DNA invertase Pin-like site-specific DNA recombinase
MMNSLSAQVSYYSEYIQKQRGWRYSGVYADDDISGTKDARPEFQRMLADCRAGKIDLLITKSISRLARNTVTLLDTVRELKALGVDVYFERENVHSLSGDGELMLTILASFAQGESTRAPPCAALVSARNALTSCAMAGSCPAGSLRWPVMPTVYMLGLPFC